MGRMAEQVDVVVIGLGVGGEEAAGRLALAGLSVVGLDPRLVGGECPYWGCVPSKMMIRAGNLIAETRRVDGMAGTATVEPDWAPVARRIREEATDTWNDQVAVDRLVGKGVTFLREPGTITGPGKVSAGKIARSELTKIAEMKMADLNANDLDQATRIIEGSARSMGLEVVEG